MTPHPPSSQEERSLSALLPEKTSQPSSPTPRPVWPRHAIGALAVTGVLGALCVLALAGNERPAKAQTQPRTAQNNPILPPERPAPPFVPPPFAPPRLPWPRPLPLLGRELQLQSVRARVDARNNVARTQLTQVFRNTSAGTIEGTYLFPVPEGAATAGFSMTQNGKKLEAETLDAEKARGIYQEIVSKLRDPALLEYADRGALRARIFPIPPGGTVEVALNYSQTLRADGGAFRYTLPLKLPVGGTPDRAVVDVHLGDAEARNVYSPTHPVAITREGAGWRASGEFQTDSERPFSLLWRGGSKEQVATTLVTYPSPGEDGYFLLLAAPDPQANEREVAAKDVVFVADTSGSMSGEKIDQLREALKTLLGNLRPADRFNIVAFASDVNSFRPTLVEATPANLEAARTFAANLRAVGGTDISDALQEAFQDLKATKGRPAQLVFMTDGQPTVGETNPDRIEEMAKAVAGPETRVFTFGVGYDVNTRLLDGLAEDGRGASDYVLPQENIETKVGALYSKIAYPVLTAPRLEWTGGSVYDVYPSRLPDVFRGSQVAVFGRYKGASAPTVRLSGSLASSEAVTRFAPVTGASTDNDTGDSIARLWATRKVGTLLDDSRREGVGLPADVRTELIALAKRFGIVTPLTANLITEDGGPMPSLPQSQARLGGARRGNADFGGGFATGGAGGGFGGRANSRGGSGGTNYANAAPQMAPPISGQAAVDAARATQSLKKAEAPAAIAREAGGASTRYVSGKTFAKRGEVWTDTAYDAVKLPKPRVVKFGSPEYWTLARDARTAKWLAISDKVLFVNGNEAISIEP